MPEKWTPGPRRVRFHPDDADAERLVEFRAPGLIAWARFVACVLFHRGSTIDGCPKCHQDYWRMG